MVNRLVDPFPEQIHPDIAPSKAVDIFFSAFDRVLMANHEPTRELRLSGHGSPPVPSSRPTFVDHLSVDDGHLDLHVEDLSRVDLEEVAINDGDVGELAGADRAANVVLEGGGGVVDGVGLECLVDADLLLRIPSALGLAVGGRAVDGGVDQVLGVDVVVGSRGSGPVGPEGEGRAVIEE